MAATNLFSEIDCNQRFMGRKPEDWMIRLSSRIRHHIDNQMVKDNGEPLIPSEDEITVYICLALEEETKGKEHSKKKHIPDPRHTPVKNKIFEAYHYFNKIYPAWGVKEAGCLSTFLKAHDWPQEKIFICIRNRFKSEENFAQEPCRWICRLGDFAGGPLDKFGKPKAAGNGQKSRTNGSGATGHLLDHLPDAEEIARRRKADDKRLEERRNARGM
jgi:hypothetical protein